MDAERGFPSDAGAGAPAGSRFRFGPIVSNTSGVGRGLDPAVGVSLPAVPGFVANIFAMCRGGMYAAPTSVINAHHKPGNGLYP